nr:nuclear receptor subfamily 1 group D member 2-like isoform X2 [Crassostrea virginica]XP_022308455.1 nuclear receptor subfamily 1 group D member 2-like isoform X2 [Crassostrea virginica]
MEDTVMESTVLQEESVMESTVLQEESNCQSNVISSCMDVLCDSTPSLISSKVREIPATPSEQEGEISCSDINSEPQKQKRKKREKYIPDAVPLELPPCKICGKKASGNHYGVNSCEACKGFFRRYLQRTVPYKCNKGGKCLENMDSKKNSLCSACRMQKCLDCGMCREGIRQGRYTATERARAIEEMKRIKRDSSQNSNKSSSSSEVNKGQSSTLSGQSLTLGNPNECLNLSLPKPDETLPSCLSLPENSGSTEVKGERSKVEEEEIKVKNVLDRIMEGYNEMNPHIKSLSDEEARTVLKQGYEKHMKKVEMFGKMDPVPAGVYSEIYSNTQMDIDGRMEIFEVIRDELATLVKEYVQFTHGIPGFLDLPPTDQAKLLKAARLEFFFILGYRSFDSETKMLMTYTGQVYPIRQYYPYISEEMAVKWVNISNDVRNLKLTVEEHAVILAICLTFTDRCELDARDQVEEIQMLFIDALQYLLKKRVANESGLHFSKIMNVFLKLREMNEEFLTFYKKMCEDPMIQKYMPELLNFLID